VYIVPWLGNATNNGTVAIEDNLLSAQFNLTVPVAQQSTVFTAYNAGLYIFRVFLSRNGATAVEYNPDMSHITTQSDRFSLIFDSTGITTSTALSVVVRVDTSMLNVYTAAVTIIPNTTATQYDYLFSAFTSLPTVIFGRFTAYATYVVGGNTQLVYL
jgi:hypothetical protein